MKRSSTFKMSPSMEAFQAKPRGFRTIAFDTCGDVRVIPYEASLKDIDERLQRVKDKKRNADLLHRRVMRQPTP